MFRTGNPYWLQPTIPQNRLQKPLTNEEIQDWINARIPEDTKVGSPILVITNLIETRRTSCSMTHGTWGDFLVTDAFLGYLKEKPFVVVSGSGIRFSASMTVSMRDGHHKLTEEPFELPFHSFGTSLREVDIREPLTEAQERDYWQSRHSIARYGEYLEKKKAGKHPGMYPLEIIVGHAAIQTICIERGTHFMSLYAAMWRWADDVPALAEELRQFELSERETVAQGILTSWERICRLDSRVKSIMQTRGTLLENGAITVCENGDDAFWISLGSRQARSEEVRKLRALLERARTLRMDHIPHTLRLMIPGASVDVPSLIAGLSEALRERKL